MIYRHKYIYRLLSRLYILNDAENIKQEACRPDSSTIYN